MPTTEHGKAIAARNATTHGLFTRDVVLPHLGEDPAGYQTLADARLDNAPSAHENCQNEPAASPVLLPQNWGPGGDPDTPVIEVDPRTHAAFLGRNEVRRVHPHTAALLCREEHRVIHAAARAQSYQRARDAGEPYF